MTITISGENVDCILSSAQDADFICIDGFPGSGKSRAGKLLAELLGATYVELDDYLERDEDREFTNYPHQIKIDELSKVLNSLEGKVIVGGCSLRAILEMLKLDKEVFFIYIKKINVSSRAWSEGYFFDDYINGGRNFSPLDKSEYEYMMNYKPHEISDVIFERLCSD